MMANIWRRIRRVSPKLLSSEQVESIVDDREKHQNDVNPQPNSPLCQLPCEILDLVSKELDILSLLALGLTCKVLWRISPTSKFRAISDDPKLMARYFVMMEACCKDYIPCYVCFKLHRRQYGEAGGEHPGRPSGGRRLCEFEAGEVRFCNHYALYHKLVLLVLRAHRRGPAYGIPLETLQHKCIQGEISSEKIGTQNIVFSISPQITTEIGLQLRLKWQYCIDPTDFAWRFSNSKHPSLIRGVRMAGCHHSAAVKLVDIARCATYHVEVYPPRDDGPASNEGCPHCNQPLQCAWCETTFVVHITKPRRTLRGGGAMICIATVTAWSNVGQGGDPRDQPWRGHISNHDGTIRTLDPGVSGRMLEEMSRYNQSYAMPYRLGRDRKIKFLQDWTTPNRHYRLKGGEAVLSKCGLVSPTWREHLAVGN